MQNMWDQRYAGDNYFYGTEPNQRFKNFIDNLTPGRILLPGEGEGRNAVYAATKQWQVFAFDSSKVAREKALKLAKQNHVKINYQIADVQQFNPGDVKFNVIAMVYLHLFPETRTSFHRKLISWLEPGGFVFMQAYDKEQLHMNTGGPKNLELLYSVAELENDFSGLNILTLKKEKIFHKEGVGHRGEAWNITLIAQK